MTEYLREVHWERWWNNIDWRIKTTNIDEGYLKKKKNVRKSTVRKLLIVECWWKKTSDWRLFIEEYYDN